jgi:hypothetical protein
MKYRDAKNLQPGDEVTRLSDKKILTVESTELYGQYKKVKINCLFKDSKISIFNDEIEQRIVKIND